MDGTSESKSNEIYYIEVPLVFKYKSKRRVNSRMYLIGGFAPSFKVESKGGLSNSESINYLPFNIEIVYGFGISIFQKYVNMAPEIRFSHGLLNILDKTIDNSFSSSIESVMPFKVGLYINFEG